MGLVSTLQVHAQASTLAGRRAGNAGEGCGDERMMSGLRNAVEPATMCATMSPCHCTTMQYFGSTESDCSTLAVHSLTAVLTVQGTPSGQLWWAARWWRAGLQRSSWPLTRGFRGRRGIRGSSACTATRGCRLLWRRLLSSAGAAVLCWLLLLGLGRCTGAGSSKRASALCAAIAGRCSAARHCIMAGATPCCLRSRAAATRPNTRVWDQ